MVPGVELSFTGYLLGFELGFSKGTKLWLLPHGTRGFTGFYWVLNWVFQREWNWSFYGMVPGILLVFTGFLLGFYWVLKCVFQRERNWAFYRMVSGVLLVFTGFLLGFEVGFYWTVLDFTEFYWVLLGFIGFHGILPSFTKFYRVLPVFLGFR